MVRSYGEKDPKGPNCQSRAVKTSKGPVPRFLYVARLYDERESKDPNCRARQVSV